MTLPGTVPWLRQLVSGMSPQAAPPSQAIPCGNCGEQSGAEVMCIDISISTQHTPCDRLSVLAVAYWLAR